MRSLWELNAEQKCNLKKYGFEFEETVKPEEEINQSLPHLKESVEWIAHPQGHWILRNPIDFTYLQVDRRSKEALQFLHRLPPEAICDRCGIPPHQLRSLLQLLAATGMLAGTTPAQPPKKKFTPLQLLFFKVPLFNPDSWLNAPARLLS